MQRGGEGLAADMAAGRRDVADTWYVICTLLVVALRLEIQLCELVFFFGFVVLAFFVTADATLCLCMGSG